MLQNFTDLLPLNQYDTHDEVVFYSQNGTGVGGRFVTLETPNQDPINSAGDFAPSTPGFNYPGVVSQRYENRRKFRVAPAGSTRFNVLGITLYGTAEFDQNDQKLILNPHRKTELGVVVSGETSNVLTDGIVRLKSTAYSGTPVAGHVACVSTLGNGTLQIFDPATLPVTGVGASLFGVVAKVISASGSAFGGFADFKLMLK